MCLPFDYHMFQAFLYLIDDDDSLFEVQRTFERSIVYQAVDMVDCEL